jgi:hypothetical protein
VAQRFQVWRYGDAMRLLCVAFRTLSIFARAVDAVWLTCTISRQIQSRAIFSPRIVMIIDFWHPDMSEVQAALSRAFRLAASSAIFFLRAQSLCDDALVMFDA